MRESPQPFTTAVLEKQLSEQAKKVKDARDYQDAAFDARLAYHFQLATLSLKNDLDCIIKGLRK